MSLLSITNMLKKTFLLLFFFVMVTSFAQVAHAFVSENQSGALLTAQSGSNLLAQAAGTDDYPSNLKSAKKDSKADPWNFYNRECTSFTAWRLNNDNGVAFHNYYKGVRWGNGGDWGKAARSVGITVDSNPAVGAVAWWGNNSNGGPMGHVAWVRSISGNNVTIEEYNWNNDGAYRQRTISKSNVSGYIHIKDLSPAPNPDTKGEMYSGNKVITVPEKTECIIKSSANKNFVWDVQGAKGYDGCNLQIFTRKDIPCQKYQFEKNSDGTYHISNWSGDYGVYVGLTDWTYANQANVVTRYTCDWSINSWYVEATPDGYYSFRNKHSGKYLEVSGGYIADGTSLKQHAGNGTAAQKFAIEFQMYKGNQQVGKDELDGKTFLIESSGAEGLVWDVAGGNGKDGTNLQVYSRNNTLAQRFVFNGNDDGTYSISNWSGTPGTLVGLAADSYLNDANIAVRHFVREWDINKWYVERTPDGYYSFRNKFSSLYADIAGGAFVSGTNIWQIAGNGTPAQKFKLIPYEPNTAVTDLPVGDPGFVIRNVARPDYVLTSDVDHWGDGCNLGLAQKASTENQRFVIESCDDGTYCMSNWASAPGLFIGLTEDSTADNANVGMRYAINTWKVNKWYVETTSDGYYAFRNVYSGKYLDAPSGGTNVAQWQNTGGNEQKWILEPCDYYYTSLNTAEIVLEESSYQYTGKPIAPTVSVKLGGATIDPECYSVQYASNIEAGEATVTVAGNKAKLYDGSATKSFTIANIPITDATISGVSSGYVYTGSPITPSPTVKHEGKTLVEGIDYAVRYSGAEGLGEASITIEGIGNYDGEQHATYMINPALINKPQTQSFTYDGASHTSIQNGGGYTLIGTLESTEAGTYQAIAQLTFGYAWDDGSFSDEVMSWSVSPADIPNASISGLVAKTYTGDSLTQSPVVKLGDKTLTSGTDYTVSYKDNVNVGTATITIAGEGNYTGVKNATFRINTAQSDPQPPELGTTKTSISKAAISGLKAVTYNGKAQTQSPTVKVGKKALKAGTDYAVSYKNNVNAGRATITIAGKGSYTGTKSATFAIAKAKNPITVRAKSPSVKASKVKKAKQSIAAKKAFKVRKPQGKVTYKKVSGNKKIKVSKAGKITVKKGLKKGEYKIKVKVTAKGNANYKSGSKTVRVKVVVK